MVGGIFIQYALFLFGKSVRLGGAQTQSKHVGKPHNTKMAYFSICPNPQPHALPRGLEGMRSFCSLKAVSSAKVGTTKSLKCDLVSFFHVTGQGVFKKVKLLCTSLSGKT